MKLRDRLKYFLKDLFAYKLAAVLAIIGMSVSIIVMVTAYTITDSYYTSLYTKYDYYRVNKLVYVDMGEDSELRDIVCNDIFLGDNLILFEKKFSSSLTYPVVVNETNQLVNITAAVYGTDSSYDGSFSLEENGVLETDIIAGRTFLSEEVTYKHNVIIIDSVTSELLYGGEALGEIIKLPVEIAYEDGNELVDVLEYEIIGVYNSSEEDYQAILNAEGNYYYAPVYYVPTTTCENNTIAEAEYKALFYDVASISDKYAQTVSLSANAVVTTYESLCDELDASMQITRRFVGYAVIMVFVIAVLLTVETMLTLIKDDISNIGIKRSLGATVFSITKEIILKLLCYAIMSLGFAYVVSTTITSLVMYIIALKDPTTKYSLHVSINTILLSVVMAFFISCLSTLIMLIYIKGKQLTEILKFE